MAPLVAALVKFGLPILAGAVQTKGKELVEEKLGVKLDDFIGTDEGRAKLKALEYEHEETLLEYADRKDARELDYFRVEVADRDSARESNARIQESEHAAWLAKNTGYILDLGVVGAAAGLILLLYFKAIPLDNRDLLMTALGVLLSQVATVFNFHRGSSRSSQTKDLTIAALSKEDGK